jgi:hypothetical protein
MKETEMNDMPMLSQTIDLGYDQLLVLRHRRGARVRVLYGGVWLTEEGEPRDRFLLGGDAARVGHDGTTVIEALAPTRLELRAAPQPRRGQRLRRGWRALRDALGLTAPAAA